MTDQQRDALRDQNPTLLKQIEHNDTDFLNTIYVIMYGDGYESHGILDNEFYLNTKMAEESLEETQKKHPDTIGFVSKLTLAKRG